MAPSARFTEDFAYEVLSVVGEIPEGTVATYGQISRLIGRNKNSRLVARVLSHASDYGEFPCHRVVNHAGRLVPGWPEQAFLLRPMWQEELIIFLIRNDRSIYMRPIRQKEQRRSFGRILPERISWILR